MNLLKREGVSMTKKECKYCEPDKSYQIFFNRLEMCDSCKEEYDDHLERKADEERDERLIERLEEKRIVDE